MAATRIEAGTRILAVISRSALVAAVLMIAGAGFAQAADSEDRIPPPNPADVAILRGLLALQNPALRQGAAPVQAAPAAVPAVTTEPNQQNKDSQPATEGEACVTPSRTGCGAQAETSNQLGDEFRDSLGRAMAAAGYDSNRM